MNIVQSLVQVDQIVLFDKPCREGFLYAAVDSFEDICLNLVDYAGGQIAFFHLLRGRIDSLKTHELFGVCLVQVNFGMHDIQFVVEHGWFPEYQVFFLG